MYIFNLPLNLLYHKMYIYSQEHQQAQLGYVFASPNPFLGHPAAFATGRDLFAQGQLGDAVFALEAELQANPSNLEAWRLLGTVHAENDDDPRAISALREALKVNPSDPESCLALGVSHTNELDLDEAVSHVRAWLRGHPQFGAEAAAMGDPLDRSQQVQHYVRVLERLTGLFSSERELFVVLGVLCNLDRDYTKAIASFERALQLGPEDYSLLNKVGATLANSGRSTEAVGYYRRALQIKPNYVRAVVNLAISYGNLGEYDAAAKEYVRALGMNAQNDQVWGYLRTVLICAGRMDLLPAIDQRDVGVLGNAF